MRVLRLRRRRRSDDQPVTSGALKKLRNAEATQAAFDSIRSSSSGSPVTALIARSAHCAGPPRASSARTSDEILGRPAEGRRPVRRPSLGPRR